MRNTVARAVAHNACAGMLLKAVLKDVRGGRRRWLRESEPSGVEVEGAVVAELPELVHAHAQLAHVGE